jgi:hypothetical protein
MHFVVPQNVSIALNAECCAVIGCLHAILSRFSKNMWTMMLEPYTMESGMAFSKKKQYKHYVKHIDGFCYDTNNIYTAIAAFLSPGMAHVMNSGVLKRLLDGYLIRNDAFKATYPIQHHVLWHMYEAYVMEATRRDSQDDSFYVDIPCRMSKMPMPPVMYIYTLLLGDILPESIAMDVFLSIRLKDTDPQSLPPVKGHILLLEQWNQTFMVDNIHPSSTIDASVDGTTPLAATGKSNHNVYSPLSHEPGDTSAMYNFLATLEVLSCFNPMDTKQIAVARDIQNTPDVIKPCAQYDTYRGCVQITDIIPYCHGGPCKELFKQREVNPWQGSVLPIFGWNTSSVESVQSPLFGSHPIVLKTLLNHPIKYICLPKWRWDRDSAPC